MADVPPGVDFHSEEAVREWIENAVRKHESRVKFFDVFVRELRGRTVIDLGSGPGILAEYILARCEFVNSYTLLDFSDPMLQRSRERLAPFPCRTSFVKIDFKESHWSKGMNAPFDAIVTNQAVHELRHKKYAPEFYRSCHEILRSGGMMLVCDYLPKDDSERESALYMTAQEQLAALKAGGFDHADVVFVEDGKAVYRVKKLPS